jgi:hypothetical protein
MKKFSDLNIMQTSQSFAGEKIKLYNLLNREITVLDYRIVASKFNNAGSERLDIELEVDNVKRLTWTGSTRLIETMKQVAKTDLPFQTTIVKDGESFKLT